MGFLRDKRKNRSLALGAYAFTRRNIFMRSFSSHGGGSESNWMDPSFSVDWASIYVTFSRVAGLGTT